MTGSTEKTSCAEWRASVNVDGKPTLTFVPKDGTMTLRAND